jgi:hypothetical protein
VSSFHDYVTLSLAIQAVMGSPYFDPCILDGGYMCIFTVDHEKEIKVNRHMPS